MTRVILTLLLICQSLYLRAADIGFTQPGLLGTGLSGKPLVVIVHDPRATHAYAADPAVVDTMVAKGVMTWTGYDTPQAAWRSLVSPEDVVGVKVHSAPGPMSGTRPAVAFAVIKGLIAAGHPPSNIILWDRRLDDLRTSRFVEPARELGIRIAGAVDSGWDPEVYYSNPLLGKLVYGDVDFRRQSSEGETNQVLGRNSYMSRLLTRQITRFINIAPLLNHIHAGASGILYTVASSSTDNFLRFETSPKALVSAVPEIFGQTNLIDRVALNIIDALIGQYEGSRQSLLQYSGVPNEIWFSGDAVALDTLALQELNNIRRQRGATVVTNGLELYENARLLELGTNTVQDLDILRVRP